MRDVAILGMHRSGTSALAGCLHLVGLHLGPAEELFPPAPENPRGFWENCHVAKLNDRVMMSLDGGSWRDPPELTAEWMHNPGIKMELQRARELVDRMRLSGPRCPLGFKDPRLCITLPFWRRVFGDRLAAVFIWRPFPEVWRSLQEREPQHFTESRAAELWLRYNGDVLKNLVGLPVYALNYHDLLDRPEHQLWRIRIFLGKHQVTGLHEHSGLDVHNFLSPRLCHWYGGKATVLTWSGLSGMTQRLKELPAESECFQEMR